jgi:23S rRNA (guanosine2251-2'-O)-methyltransferase
MNKANVVFGFHAVISRLRTHSESVRELYVVAARHDARMRDLVARAQVLGIRSQEVNAQRLDSLAGTTRHQGVVALVSAIAPSATLEDALAGLSEPALLLVLDGVQDPHNLGACLRVADAMGAHAVIAPKDRAVGMTPTVAKVASGAADTVPYIQVTNLARTLRELKDVGVWLVGADHEASTSMFAMRLSGPIAWVLGSEGQGLRRLTRESCDELCSIPMQGTVASLNVSVAAGICLYENRRQRALRPSEKGV